MLQTMVMKSVYTTRFDVTEAQLSIIGIYILSGIFGTSMWSAEVTSFVCIYF